MNEAVFRAANDVVAENAAERGVDYAWIFCECGRESCTKRLELTHEEYQRVREHPSRFIVVRGHVMPELERVAEELGGGALVVEKQGIAAEVAEDAADAGLVA